MITQRDESIFRIGYDLAVYERLVLLTRANRTRPALSRLGYIKGISHIVMTRRKGLARLVKAGFSDHCFERIVLDFPRIFTDRALRAKAKANLAGARR